MEMLKEGLTPRKILTRETMLNGIAGAMATGSSTNLVLHLMAIAHEAGVELTLEDFDRISARCRLYATSSLRGLSHRIPGCQRRDPGSAKDH